MDDNRTFRKKPSTKLANFLDLTDNVSRLSVLYSDIVNNKEYVNTIYLLLVNVTCFGGYYGISGRNSRSKY